MTSKFKPLTQPTFKWTVMGAKLSQRGSFLETTEDGRKVLRVKNPKKIVETLIERQHNSTLEYTWAVFPRRNTSFDLVSYLQYAFKYRWHAVPFMWYDEEHVTFNYRFYREAISPLGLPVEFEPEIPEPFEMDVTDYYQEYEGGTWVAIHKDGSIETGKPYVILLGMDEFDENRPYFTVFYWYLTMPRFVSHQLVRHRGFSFIQESQRRVKVAKYYIPHSIWRDESSRQRFIDVLKVQKELYNDLVNNYEVPKEDARAIAPIGTMTTIVMATPFYALVNYFALRRCKKAQSQHRNMAETMAQLIKKHYPQYYELMPLCRMEVMGFCSEEASCPKAQVVNKEKIKLYDQLGVINGILR